MWGRRELSLDRGLRLAARHARSDRDRGPPFWGGERGCASAAHSGKPRFSSLSAQLLLLTVLFVMLAEVLIFLAFARELPRQLAKDRLTAARIASLAIEASPEGGCRTHCATNLKFGPGSGHRHQARGSARDVAPGRRDPLVDESFDLRSTAQPTLAAEVWHAWNCWRRHRNFLPPMAA